MNLNNTYNQYTLRLSGGRSQDVTSDLIGNVVKYHVADKDHEAWVVSDFNKVSNMNFLFIIIFYNMENFIISQ